AKMASTTTMVQEKGSRNKRKFKADPPPVTDLKSVSLSNECLGYEFTAESFVTHEHVNGCDMCCFGRESVDLVELDLGLLCLVDSLREHHFEDLHQMEIVKVVKVVNGGGSGGCDLTELLNRVNMMDCRVYVVHAHPDSGLAIFSVANKIGMMTSSYVWITTDWLLAALDSSEIPDPKSMDLIQGGIKDKQTSSFNLYALYAYDSVWLLAYAQDKFLKSGGSNFGLSAL
ncbi:glutamate receptor 3.4-like protein, partial [Tanacetum coccineum]